MEKFSIKPLDVLQDGTLNVQIKYYSDDNTWINLYPKTTASLITLKDGNDLETLLYSLIKETKRRPTKEDIFEIANIKFDEAIEDLKNHYFEDINDELQIIITNETERKTNEIDRQTNELLRIELYNQVKTDYDSGNFKGEKGDNLRFEDLTPEQKLEITGTMENLNANHIETALGYIPLDSTRVKTDVPENAIFTDTVVDVSNFALKSSVKTPVPENAVFTDTIVDESQFVTNDRVKTDVPENAVFTDTIQDLGNYVTKDRVLTDVPLGAKFTDTIPTKENVGLDKVDNVKQMPLTDGMPKRAGIFTNFRQVAVNSSGIIDLANGNIFVSPMKWNATFNVSNGVSGVYQSWKLIIQMGTSLKTVNFGDTIRWKDELVPTFTKTTTTTELEFFTLDGGAKIYGKILGVYNSI